MQFPRINLNGTSVDTLIRETYEAYNAVAKAREYLGAMTVHGRDYQTFRDPSTAFTAAHNEHIARLRKLDDIAQELADLYQELCAQKENRA